MAGTPQWTPWGGVPPFADDPRRACAGTPVDVFFPAGGGASGLAAAKKICRRCPLVDDCAAWAIPQVALKGIWGSLTEPERERIRAGVAPWPQPVRQSKPAPPRGKPPKPKVAKAPSVEDTERRLAAGRAAAAARTAQRMAKVADLAATGMMIKDMAALTGYSSRTVNRYLKMLRNQAHPNGDVAA